MFMYILKRQKNIVFIGEEKKFDEKILFHVCVCVCELTFLKNNNYFIKYLSLIILIV